MWGNRFDFGRYVHRSHSRNLRVSSRPVSIQNGPAGPEAFPGLKMFYLPWTYQRR
jgi:hypothetical protein